MLTQDVNDKKLSRMTKLIIIIAIILSVVLVSTLAIAISGAWFTDSATSTMEPVSLRFGTIDAGDFVVSANVSEKVYPGKLITYEGVNTDPTDKSIYYTGNINAYYRITLSVDNVQNGTLNSTQLNALTNWIGFTSVAGFDCSESGNRVVYGRFVVGGISPVVSIPTGTLTFSSNATNDYQGLDFKITMTFDIIQLANINGTISITDNQDTYTLNDLDTVSSANKLALYQQLFTYYSGLNS